MARAYVIYFSKKILNKPKPRKNTNKNLASFQQFEKSFSFKLEFLYFPKIILEIIYLCFLLDTSVIKKYL